MTLDQLVQDVKDEVAKLEAAGKADFLFLKAKIEALFSHPLLAPAAADPVAPVVTVEPAPPSKP